MKKFLIIFSNRDYLDIEGITLNDLNLTKIHYFTLICDLIIVVCSLNLMLDPNLFFKLFGAFFLIKMVREADDIIKLMND
jgi:hypothetical protein